jgi:hypothetical protein
MSATACHESDCTTSVVVFRLESFSFRLTLSDGRLLLQFFFTCSCISGERATTIAVATIGKIPKNNEAGCAMPCFGFGGGVVFWVCSWAALALAALAPRFLMTFFSFNFLFVAVVMKR